ncbi:MAG: hypothetical protein EBY28_08890 [Betaproteobacteria bacterium]|nr:hypothetical protein [Betaproteobacteria bacterium]
MQRSCASSCTQATPAGLPNGMPGIALLIDGAMQQAAQALRHGGAGVTGRSVNRVDSVNQHGR